MGGNAHTHSWARWDENDPLTALRRFDALALILEKVCEEGDEKDCNSFELLAQTHAPPTSYGRIDSPQPLCENANI